MKKLALLLCAFLLFFSAMAQKPLSTTPYRQDSLNMKRVKFVVGFEAGLAVSTSVGLYLAWYSGYDLGRFHWLNDNYGWLQLDKGGHTFTNYHLLSGCYSLNRWAGLEQKKAMLIAAGIATGFHTTIEIFDGLSEAWGASLGDIAANALGTATYLSQELMWNEQRVIWKMSFNPQNYSLLNEEMYNRALNLYGASIPERILKDYNGHTFWLSVNPKSFSNGMEWIPDWLNVAVGYGGQGMFGANWNVWYDKNGCYKNYEGVQRYRQYYLSLDIDWERVPTRSKLIKAMAPFLNIIKIPFPTLEYNRIDGLKGYVLYF